MLWLLMLTHVVRTSQWRASHHRKQDGFRILPFTSDAADWMSNHLGNMSFLLNNYPAGVVAPSAELLRWHFEQAVLGRVRAAGEVADQLWDDEEDLGTPSFATSALGHPEKGRAAFESYLGYALRASV
jgi:hypothetical protein